MTGRGHASLRRRGGVMAGDLLHCRPRPL